MTKIFRFSLILLSFLAVACDSSGASGERTPAVVQDGTLENPFLIADTPYTDTRDTSESSSDVIDSYPPDSTNMGGPEYIYRFTIGSAMHVQTSIVDDAETDVDVHLLSSISPVTLIQRNGTSVETDLSAGTYYLSIDTYVNAGTPQSGVYTLTVNFTE